MHLQLLAFFFWGGGGNQHAFLEKTHQQYRNFLQYVEQRARFWWHHPPYNEFSFRFPSKLCQRWVQNRHWPINSSLTAESELTSKQWGVVSVWARLASHRAAHPRSPLQGLGWQQIGSSVRWLGVTYFENGANSAKCQGVGVQRDLSIGLPGKKNSGLSWGVACAYVFFFFPDWEIWGSCSFIF